MKTYRKHRGRRRPLKMLDFAKKVLRLRVLPPTEEVKEIMTTLKNLYGPHYGKYASFLPVIGKRFDRGRKDYTYFYYFLYNDNRVPYRISPNVVLVAVGTQDYVLQHVKYHLDFVKSLSEPTYGPPVHSALNFERSESNAESNINEQYETSQNNQ